MVQLLLHFLGVLSPNTHDIGELSLQKKGRVAGSQMGSLGGGLYNTLSLFNHSCEPCFMRANVRGKAVVCVTVKAIQKGQEITENYGLSYVRDAKERRQTILREHYGFECVCTACREDWPSKAIMKQQQQEAAAAAAEKDEKRKKHCEKVVSLLMDASSSSSSSAMPDLERLLLGICCGDLEDLDGEESRPPPPPNYSLYQVQNAVWEYLWLSRGNKRIKSILK